MINQDLWETKSNGYITIKFYVNDTQGNIGFNEVIIVRDAPTTSPSPPGISGYNILLLIGIISIVNRQKKAKSFKLKHFFYS